MERSPVGSTRTDDDALPWTEAEPAPDRLALARAGSVDPDPPLDASNACGPVAHVDRDDRRVAAPPRPHAVGRVDRRHRRERELAAKLDQPPGEPERRGPVGAHVLDVPG